MCGVLFDLRAAPSLRPQRPYRSTCRFRSFWTRGQWVRHLLLLPSCALTLGSYAGLPFPTREGPLAALPSPRRGEGVRGVPPSPPSAVGRATAGYGCPLFIPVVKNDRRPEGRVGPPVPAVGLGVVFQGYRLPSCYALSALLVLWRWRSGVHLTTSAFMMQWSLLASSCGA